MKVFLQQVIKSLVVFLIVANVLVAFAAGHSALAQEQPSQEAAAGQQQEEEGSPMQNRAISIAIVVGVSAIAAGFAVARVGSAAIGAVSERPEIFGRTLVYVGLAEGIAIYGLIIGIMLMGAS